MHDRKNTKRIPIRKRVLVACLLTTIIAMLATVGISLTAIFKIKNDSINALTLQLEHNFKSLVEQKAKNTDTRLEYYEKNIVYFSDYIEDMYKNRDELIASGKYIDAPRATTPKDVYAMSGILATEDMTPKDVHDDMFFFSHMEKSWKPVVENNDGIIDTVYVGTKSGFLPAYDKYSYLAAVPEGKYSYYNFKESEWYKKGMSENGIIYTEVYIDSQGKGLTITIGKGYNDANGERQGVCCADFDLNGLYKEMISIDFGRGATSFALDPKGNIISPQRKEVNVFSETGLSKIEIESILKKNGILQKEDAFYIYATVMRVGWTLCARIPKSLVMEGVKAMDQTIWTAIIATVCGLLAIILTIIVATDSVAASITRPMEQLCEDMETIGRGNLEHKASIIRNDEVGDIAMQLNAMVDRLKATSASLRDSRQETARLTEIATTDPLTGVRNKTSYDSEIQKIDSSIADGETDFGIAMVDLNFLKKINDVYGHEKGNIAITKVCATICNVFAHSPVYRVGGDEFVVVLKNRDFHNISDLVSEFNARIAKLRNDTTLEPWERISAAIGYALFDPQLDSKSDTVFMRADKAMYEHKKAMKALRTE